MVVAGSCSWLGSFLTHLPQSPSAYIPMDKSRAFTPFFGYREIGLDRNGAFLSSKVGIPFEKIAKDL